MSQAATKFSAGRNIAMKVPPHQCEATVRFYRDGLQGKVAVEVQDAGEPADVTGYR